jgi:predicted nucleic acid-binding protein
MIYIDVCALQRPYDDKRYYRIRMEAAAVEMILSQVKNSVYTLYYSPVHADEIARNSNTMMRIDLEMLLHSLAKSIQPLIRNGNALEQRGWDLHAAGLGIADSFHLAYAEIVGADFITCDDELLNRSRRCKIDVWCGTPVDFCKKERLI